MRMALQLAELGRGQTSPNPLVGCVIVKDGEIIGQGAHLRAGTPHAEVHALRMAGERAAGATVYVTLEPCSHYGRTPPCADALVAAGVRRVVIAAEDPDPRVSGRGVARLRAAGIEVVSGVLAEEAQRQNEGFRSRILRGRPQVVWKCAATLDGYIAAETGHSQYVTGASSRALVQELRRQHAAIAVGIGTALADDPRLTVRSGPATPARQPLRVVFDSRLRLPVSARMLREPGRTLVVTTAEAAATDGARRLRDAGAEIAPVAAGPDGRVDLAVAVQRLADEGINEVLVEGGSTLVSALLKRRLVDKVIYFIAPKLLGGGIPALTGLGPRTMADAVPLEVERVTTHGTDLCLWARPRYEGEMEDVHGSD
ncbi:MAG: bifunctional diaminohydroxyphosphoribosylaminopyrimidine deaminase/5-amino-6-(5-phosphoribosylamino)uracil reductase RibD [Thermoflavifilum sp.]|nr:bifunctional diaminohydroxyphosphoribosylaminopyrimidine deaminase/5-amino-6-(5-phosphoribosylamino)uracil reductase RibD [Thermoflavifilum sp.]MCL6513069.1 bifunctional diaminohydroxyphosphoribosylaminopyrimidine deaminase/5-amino-6-(5-phosphoribosylamino)uracil reductase RibD [Alicyclobacillus sp.]